MKRSDTSIGSNVVPLSSPESKAAKLRSEKKWGAGVMKLGFCIVPSLLFRAQRRLGLKPNHLALILQLAEFWWHDDKLPWPKKATLAERMGMSEKQIQRLVAELEKRGYVKRNPRNTAHGQTSNSYDMAGLVAALKRLEPEFREASKAKQKVERRGGLRQSES